VICYITENCFNKIREEMDKFPQSETGGAILGYKSDHGNYVITHVTGPGKGAVHQYAYFETGDCQEEVDQIWYGMFGAVTILGYWHRHFEPVPRPSHIDIETVTSSDDPLMLIVGTEKSKVWDRQMNEVELYLWDQ
jgi:integrative and conjugative element protein (TIGR02256 family)